MHFFETIISNPFYIFLFGSGGVLAIIISICAIISSKKYKNRIKIVRSKKTSIKGNKINNQSINVNNCEETEIHNNFR